MELVYGCPQGFVSGAGCAGQLLLLGAWPWDLQFERWWSLFPGIPWVPAGEGLHQGTFYLSRGSFASAITLHRAGAAKRCKACETTTQWIFHESQASNIFAVHSIQEAGVLLWCIKKEFKFWTNVTYVNLFFRSCPKHMPWKLGHIGEKKKDIREIQPKYDLQEMALWNKSFSILVPPPRDQLLSDFGLMDKKKTKVEVKVLAWGLSWNKGLMVSLPPVKIAIGWGENLEAEGHSLLWGERKWREASLWT